MEYGKYKVSPENKILFYVVLQECDIRIYLTNI